MKKLLITDVDNTLFDWFDVWHASFSAMLNKTLEISGVDRCCLLQEMRKVFQHHHTSEYAFVLEECPSLKGLSVKGELAPAVAAYRTARDAHLHAYPTVIDSLAELTARGIPVIAYTESIRFYTSDRLRRLGLDGYLTALYSPADHVLPAHMSAPTDPVPALRKEETPAGETKPNVHILRSMMKEFGFDPSECVYIGDNKSKDIAMANDASVTSVWAAYGATPDNEAYELLRKVSHWPDIAIQTEKKVNAGEVIVVADVEAHQFSDVLELF